MAKKSEDDLGDIDLESMSGKIGKGTKGLGKSKIPGKEPVQKASKISAPKSSGGGAKIKAPKPGKISAPRSGGGAIKAPRGGKAPMPTGAFKLRMPEKPKLKAKRGR